MAKTIRVPKVPRAAFDPTRPPSSLLRSHVEQLQKGVLAAIRTEADAAEAIELLTRLLQKLRPNLAPRAHHETVRRRPRRRPTAQRRARPRRSRSRARKRKS